MASIREPVEKGRRKFAEPKKSSVFRIIMAGLILLPIFIWAIAGIFGYELKTHLYFLNRSPLTYSATSAGKHLEKHSMLLTKDWSPVIDCTNKRLSFSTLPAEAEIEVMSPIGCLRLAGQNAKIPWNYNQLSWRICNDQPYEEVVLFYEISN